MKRKNGNIKHTHKHQVLITLVYQTTISFKIFCEV